MDPNSNHSRTWTRLDAVSVQVFGSKAEAEAFGRELGCSYEYRLRTSGDEQSGGLVDIVIYGPREDFKPPRYHECKKDMGPEVGDYDVCRSCRLGPPDPSVEREMPGIRAHLS